MYAGQTNEIKTAIPLLDAIDIQGKDITADALLTQRKIATYLVKDREAHYHFTVKANQPTLLEDLEFYFRSREKPDFVDFTPPDHGRIETRAMDVELLRRFPRALPHVPFFRHQGNRNRSRVGQPFGDKYFWKWWKRACKNLGIEGVDLYGGTRHSSATALQEYFSPEEIKKATMHGTNTAFQRYFRTDIRRLKAVYEKANGGKDEEKAARKVVEGFWGTYPKPLFTYLGKLVQNRAV